MTRVIREVEAKGEVLYEALYADGHKSLVSSSHWTLYPQLVGSSEQSIV